MITSTRIFSGLLALIFVAASCTNDKESSDTQEAQKQATGNTIKAPDPLSYTIDAVYPHDPQAFTQGLQFYNGKLYEGTGLEGKSTLRIVNIKTGIPEKKYLISDPKVFGEGITIFNNKIYQLTWQTHKIFVYNINNITKQIGSLNWKYEGWGITNDGKSMIISDGSEKLYYVLPDEGHSDVKMLKALTVMDNNGKVDSLNELEYINGFIYANRWLTDDIYKIDTANGHVVGKLNLAGLIQTYAPNEHLTDGAVLNGIAYDSATKKLFITGKNWPRLFEMHFN